MSHGTFLHASPLLKAKQIILPSPKEQAAVVRCLSLARRPERSPTPPFMRARALAFAFGLRSGLPVA